MRASTLLVLAIGSLLVWHSAAGEPPAAAGGDPARRTAAAVTSPTARILYRSGARQQRGAEFVPSRAAKGRPLPLLLIFDPGGDAEGAVRRWSEAAEARGWLLASTTAVRNGTPDEADEVETLALLKDMQRRHAVDPDRVAVSGFSGGGCGAYRIALRLPERFRGAIVECGHMGPWRDFRGPYPTGHPFYLFTRADDFNRDATRKLRDAMEDRGLDVGYAEGLGGHQPMTGRALHVALEWLEARLAR